MTYVLPDISTVGQLNREEQTEFLGHLFEPCQTLSTFVIERVLPGSFASYKQLIEAIRAELIGFLKSAEADAKATGNPVDERISQIIAAHPRLGGSSKATTVKLSSHSSAEQKSLQGNADETHKLIQLNDLYEMTFPGLRYVVFVNGRSRPVIMENMAQRIQKNDILAERAEAFNAMCDIAWDRAQKLGSK